MDDNLCEEFEHNGKTVRIYYDTESGAGNPRDADNLGIMLANGNWDYTLGDAEFSSTSLLGYDDAERALEHYADRRKIHLFPRWCRIHLGSSIVLPLGLIDHSGISMYVGGGAHPMDPGGWDSGLVGFIFDTAQTREVTGVELDNVEQGLRAEVKEYDQYLRGDVYGYIVEDADGNDEDSCWGFLGDEYVKQEARDAAGYTCVHCDEDIHRWGGSATWTIASDWVHTVCVTCGGAIEWGSEGWFHLHLDIVNPQHHKADVTHRHACVTGASEAAPKQEVGSYS